MILRSVLRYLSEAGRVPKGWEEALPKVANRSHARLPKNLSKEQVEALRAACREEKPGHFRNRALLLLFLRLGLRVQEVAGLASNDIDWKNGYLKVRCTKRTVIASSLFRKMSAERSSLIYASVARILNEYLSR